MRTYGIILAIIIIEVCSASEISLPNNDEHLAIAAANIVDRCFGSSERWSEVVIIPGRDSSEIIRNIHHQSKTANLIVFPDSERYNEFARPRKRDEYSTTDAASETTNPTAVIIISHSLEYVKYALSLLKKGIITIWKPESYFLIILGKLKSFCSIFLLFEKDIGVVSQDSTTGFDYISYNGNIFSETRCDTVDVNNVFKVIWDHWILNANILCSTSNRKNRNPSEIELYTFNPYSGDHSEQWKTFINETVEAFTHPGKFNHSWYIFERRFTRIQTFEDCSNIFFDKTSNLDGYVIPISLSLPGMVTGKMDTTTALWFGADVVVIKTLSKKLRFDIAEVSNDSPVKYAPMLKNGSYIGALHDLYTGRSHLTPNMLLLNVYPGIGMTYPHEKSAACLASWNPGIRPYWTNFAAAKQIWIGLAVSALFTTLVLYLQNKSKGIVSAFLDAQRLLVGSSIIGAPTVLKHRIVLGSIFIVALVVDGAIKGRFISLLTVGIPYPNIDTIEQLEQLDIEISGPLRLKDAITHPRLRARYNHDILLPDCVNSLTVRKNHQRVCFGGCKWLLFMDSDPPDVYKSSTPVWSRDQQFSTALHWPMASRWTFEVQRLIETGIYKKWQFNIDREIEVDGWKLKRAAEQPPHLRQARLNDLLPAFVVLGVGLSVALIVFAWEKKLFFSKNYFYDKP